MVTGESEAVSAEVARGGVAPVLPHGDEKKSVAEVAAEVFDERINPDGFFGSVALWSRASLPLPVVSPTYSQFAA